MDSTILTVMNKIGEVLGLAAAEYRRVADVDAQVRDMRSKLQFLMAWIQMAEERSHDQLVRVWVSQIREAVCAAEDIVEEYCHEMFTSRRPGLETADAARRRWQPLSWFPFPVREVPVRYSLSQRISDVLLQLDGIRNNSLLDMPNRVDGGGVPIFDRPSIYSATSLEYHGSKRRPTGGIPRQFVKRFEDIYVEEYTNAIRTSLLDDDRKRRATVMVTGESGIGKTTVAKEFLNDRAVLRHFDICAWVFLPPESRLDMLWDQIYQQAREQIPCDCPKREDVKQLLARRRYLVVLDGMDNMVKLKSLLRELPPDGVNGSGILVTTQLLREEIVRHAIPDVTQVVEMKCLERSNCLALFDKWVCVGTEAAVKDYSMFEDKVYRTTRGLPLAVVLLGGLLYCKDHLSQWDEVFKLLESNEHMRLIKRILTVSLATMPPVVKLCFLYLAAMPQNVQLDEDVLVTLWCAEGFFESEDRDEATEEEIAERCYSVLVLRGLVQPGKAPFFKPTIHENVHNFAKRIARETNFLECSNEFDIRNASVVRRLSIHNYVDRRLQITSSFPKLRTLLGDFVEDQAANPSLQIQGSSFMSSFRGSKAMRRTSRLDFICQSKFLRVVDLQGARLGMLPDSIGDMIHLRYLGLRSCSLTDLPPSVARLLNLETLDITGNDVQTIVDEFWMSEKLKHVLAKKLVVPGLMGTLRKLMTLHGVISSSLWTQDNCPFIEMKSLLSLEMLGVTDTVVEMMVMALDKLDSPLHHLRLVGDCIHPMVLSCGLNSLRSLELDGKLVSEKFGTGRLFLPPNLYRLVLRSTCISQELFDKICADATFELELLDNSFTGSRLSFEENGFERLRKLKIGNLGALEELVIGESSLRYLDTLEVFGCPNMKSIQGLENVYDLDHMVFYEMAAVVAQIKADDQQLFDKIKHLRAVARAGDTKFDASQYAFFGNNVVEEVELGGLDDDGGGDAALVGPGDEEYLPYGGYSLLEDKGLGSFNVGDDLAGTFNKLTRIIDEPKQQGILSHKGSFSRQSSNADWRQESGSSYWPTEPILDTEQGLDKNWWSQPPHSANFHDSRLYRASSSPQQDDQYNSSESNLGAKPSPLHRTSSYPQKEPQYSNTEPIPVPKSFISYPPSGAASHSSPGQLHHMNMPSPPTAFQMPISAQNDLPLPQVPHGGTPPGPRFGRDLAHMGSGGLTTQNLPENHVLNSGPMRGNGPRFMPGVMQHQMQRSNGLMPQPRQQHGMLPIQQSPPHFSQLHAQMLGPQHSPPQNMQMFAPQHPPSQVTSRFDANFAMPDLSDPRARSMLHLGRQGQRYPHQGYERMRMDNGWPRFRSKYMSTEEIENIARMQQAATHINDPYIDDYYHQACLAKKSAGAQLKHHFCPTLIRDPSSRAHNKDEPHAYLQVDALGRLPFSSIRRPRPLLDVESASAPSDNIEKSASKPLDQEPMLAARITIEDGLCLLLDVDDIDRLLQFNQQQDGGLQLRNRRQTLLEKLAESLQLVDPLASNKNAPVSSNDDLVFLRIVALPKGRKLLSRYLELVTSGSELARIACMAVFRHLRLIFGVIPSDVSAAETITKLTSAISACVRRMELSDLSACLAAIVCSSLKPPLRPLGYPAGDWASVIIKSVLDKATELLTNQNLASSHSMQNRALWQASFDAFFSLLTQYCMSKFDSVVHTAQLHPAAAAAISREMPVELLRASLPHTNEDQRKQLLSFAQRTVPVSSNSSNGSGTGSMTSDSVPT